MLPHGTFDATASIAFLYLWMFFAYFTVLNSCDFQRLAQSNVYIQHLMAFTAFFFLITVVDTNNKASLGMTWLKTLVVYILFVMTTKAKLPAILAIVLLLIIDLSLKTHIQYIQKNNPDQEHEQSPSRYEKYRTYAQYMLYAVIVLGFLHYALYQEKSYGNNFSLSTFLFGTGKCHK